MAAWETGTASDCMKHRTTWRLGLAWNLPSGWTFKIEPTFGLNGNSNRFLLRWGASYEIAGFGQRVGQLFRGKSE